MLHYKTTAIDTKLTLVAEGTRTHAALVREGKVAGIIGVAKADLHMYIGQARLIAGARHTRHTCADNTHDTRVNV